MLELNANVARFYFEPAQLPPQALLVARFRGTEEISRLFRFELDLVSEDPYIDFAALLNQPATLIMMRGTEAVPVAGIVADFQQLGRTEEYVSYRAVLVPRVWLLTLHYQSRIFQELSVPDIIQRVLDEAGVPLSAVRFDLTESYDLREYCVQYRETDFDFICRLMEHEGIWWHIEHGEDGDTLVISDDRSTLAPIAGESSLPYHQGAGLLRPGTDRVHAFHCREQIVTGKVILRDYNYRTPSTDLKAESQINGEMPGLYYDYGDHHKDTGTGDRLATVRNEEIECRRRVLTGESDCPGLRAGFTFSLERHYRSDLDADYLLTHVAHEGSQWRALGLVDPKGTAATDTASHYWNRFTCLPATAPFRPERRTPEPRIPGIMTATVGSPEQDDYAHLDDQGRYRAQMFFDLTDPTDDTGTRPIRMAQPYSGPNYGVHFPNHAATEMVWACIDGNVDRPMALGTVPNPEQASPSIAENRWQSVIRTWGLNELTFDDKVGEENIYMHATKDQTIDVVNNRTKDVGHDQAETVGNNKSIEVAVNHTESIGNNKSLDVGKNHDERVGSDMTIQVGKNLTESVAINYTETVGASMSLTVGVNETVTVGNDLSETTGNDKTVVVGNDLTETVAKNKTVEVGEDLSETVGGNHHEEVTEEFAVNAKKIQLMAEDQITLKVGKAEIIMKKNGDIFIKGKKIQAKGSGDVIIKGKKIKEN